MSAIILTKNSTPIIGQISSLLGYIMEGIFWVLDKIGIPSVALSIILFTIVVYLLMLPLTYKQQKFSKLSNKMNPEIQAIQKKYKNKNDNDSMMAMQSETQAVYAKYGVRPMGSCIQLLIQLPILFALYRVIYQIPAYIGKVKEAFFPLVDNLIAEEGSAEFIQTFSNASLYSSQFTNEEYLAGNVTYIQNTFVDVLNKASTTEWASIATQYPNLAEDVENTVALLTRYNNMFGMNIGNAPSYYFTYGIENGLYGWAVAAFIIPVLAAATQWLNVKLMPQQENQNTQDNSMAQSMKMMNNIMPIMSAVFCYTLPAGVGLYWVAAAVVRGIQQVAINRYIDKKVDMESLLAKNEAKAKAKKEKQIEKMRKAGVDEKTIRQYAGMSTKNVSSSSQSSSGKSPTSKSSSGKISSKANYNNRKPMTQEEKEEAVKKSTEMYNTKAPKPGSLTAKANMVKIYNENNEQEIERRKKAKAAARKKAAASKEKSKSASSGSNSAAEMVSAAQTAGEGSSDSGNATAKEGQGSLES